MIEEVSVRTAALLSNNGINSIEELKAWIKKQRRPFCAMALWKGAGQKSLHELTNLIYDAGIKAKRCHGSDPHHRCYWRDSYIRQKNEYWELIIALNRKYKIPCRVFAEIFGISNSRMNLKVRIYEEKLSIR